MKRNIERFLGLRPVRFITDIIRIYFKEHVSRSAAQLAYFLILTFFPILICITAFTGMINVRLSDQLSDLSHLLPESVYNIFRDYLGYLDNNLSTAMLITGIALTVFFASAAIRGLTSIMHEIYGEPKIASFRHFAASVIFALMLLVTVCYQLIFVQAARDKVKILSENHSA